MSFTLCGGQGEVGLGLGPQSGTRYVVVTLSWCRLWRFEVSSGNMCIWICFYTSWFVYIMSVWKWKWTRRTKTVWYHLMLVVVHLLPVCFLTCIALIFSISWSVLEAPSRTEFTPSFLRHHAVGIWGKHLDYNMGYGITTGCMYAITVVMCFVWFPKYFYTLG